MSYGFMRSSGGVLVPADVNLVQIKGVAPTADDTGTKLGVSCYGKTSGGAWVNFQVDASGKAYIKEASIKTPPATADLPKSSDNPIEITLTGKSYILGTVLMDFYWTIANDLATALTYLAANSTRGTVESGPFKFTVEDTPPLKLYIRSQGIGVTNGLTYWFEEK